MSTRRRARGGRVAAPKGGAFIVASYRFVTVPHPTDRDATVDVWMLDKSPEFRTEASAHAYLMRHPDSPEWLYTLARARPAGVEVLGHRRGSVWRDGPVPAVSA